jgi:hypothetical protein
MEVNGGTCEVEIEEAGGWAMSLKRIYYGVGIFLGVLVVYYAGEYQADQWHAAHPVVAQAGQVQLPTSVTVKVIHETKDSCEFHGSKWDAKRSVCMWNPRWVKYTPFTYEGKEYKTSDDCLEVGWQTETYGYSNGEVQATICSIVPNPEIIATPRKKPLTQPEEPKP